VTSYVALIRAVNVSGTGKLSKEELKAMGEACGFEQVRTFINSGNLLFASNLAEGTVKQRVEERLAEHFGRAVPAHVRSAKEMAEAVKKNPFPHEPSNRVMALFIEERPTKAMLDAATGLDKERLELGPRLIYIAYDDGMAHSKLKLSAMREGTARNMNSVAKIAELLAGME
jgi:uncharacterized protein (DUF1697 family)